MSEIIRTPKAKAGFIENLNLVADHIRYADESIFKDVEEWIELSRRWAMENPGVEPDPDNYPGKYSSLSYSVDSENSSLSSSASAQNSETSANNSSIYATNSENSATESSQFADNSEASSISSASSANDSQLSAWDSEAEKMTSEQYATELNDPVTEYVSNDDGTFSEVITTNRSAAYWANEAKHYASGFKFLGTWDSVDCSLPPTPDQPPLGESADGSLYIVQSVSGDTSLCPDLTVGDWLIWTGDDENTDGVVEGNWEVINWTFDWSAITNVPNNVLNAITDIELQAGLDTKLSLSGGTITGELNVIDPIADNNAVNKKYTDTRLIDGGTY